MYETIKSGVAPTCINCFLNQRHLLYESLHHLTLWEPFYIPIQASQEEYK